MARNLFSLRKLFCSLCKILVTHTCNPQQHQTRKTSASYASHIEFSKNPFQNKTLMFHVEGALLRSSSIFPYFLLVCIEAGSPIRALILLLLYPLVWLVGEEMGLEIMVFVSFVGIKAESFRIGTTVLPKFFLEDVGRDGFYMVLRCGKRIALSDMPRVMVEGFLKHYLGTEMVVGRELKVVFGHFVGLMEAKQANKIVFNEIFGEKGIVEDVIGLGCLEKSLNKQLFSHCKALYLVTEAEKRNWRTLSREKYSKPLIFHDGRLAFRPSPLATIAMFIWVPFGLVLFVIRTIVGVTLPYQFSIPVLHFTGFRSTLSEPKPLKLNTEKPSKSKGTLYICNHKTLFDPLYASFALMKPLIAVTYSLSRVAELLSPIKTVRLTRNRDKDSKLIQEMLRKSDIAICPEGTTCREPYLLRFSPLFAELSDDIVPMAIDIQVSMFYATTASGFKWLDPVFMLMNPYITCAFKILEKLAEESTCGKGGKSKFEVANSVQAQIGKALGFECTGLTRKDKYLFLAGNEGRC